MAGTSDRGELVNLLKELGLKEYEARCFVALTQLPDGTAKQISDISEVPRTRVYDAIRVLEGQGLVEVQHSDPKRFRAVGVDEAAQTLRQEYEDRISTLETQLKNVEPVDGDEGKEEIHEVWSLAGQSAIQSRTVDLLEAAHSEIFLIVADERMLTNDLLEAIDESIDRGKNVIVGGLSPEVTSRLETELPEAEVFESTLKWLRGPETTSEVAISRLLLVDQTNLLVSSFYPGQDLNGQEQAVIANGLTNGLVVIIRRLLSTGALIADDIST